MPKITVVTPSVRQEFLEVVKKCLDRQTFQDYEWIIIHPDALPWFGSKTKIIHDPPKRDGDYYRLNGAWNNSFKQAQGELIVSIVDGLWFSPDTLEKLWIHYQTNPKACVTTIGHQYNRVENGKPEGMVWRDPRKRDDFGSFYEVSPREMELCIASIPLQAIKESGGMDEEFDKYAALSEKELCYRLDKLGYTFWIDQSLEYRAIKHDRIGGSEKWDQAYFKGCEYYDDCLKDIFEGKRLKLAYLDET